MTPQYLPKLIIHQPDWIEEIEQREHEAYVGFRRQMALKKLLALWDDWEIEECLELPDDDPVVIGILLDIGLDPGVEALSIRELWRDIDLIVGVEVEVEVEEEVREEAELVLVDGEDTQEGEEDGADEEWDGSDEYQGAEDPQEGDDGEGYEGDDEEDGDEIQSAVDANSDDVSFPLKAVTAYHPTLRNTRQVDLDDTQNLEPDSTIARRSGELICLQEGKKTELRDRFTMTMGCGPSKAEQATGSSWEPRTPCAAGPSHDQHGQEPNRPGTGDDGSPPRTPPPRPRLYVVTCAEKATADEISRAMATNPKCNFEDSPTWPNLSPVSQHLAAWREPAGSETWDERAKREDRDVRKIDQGSSIYHERKAGWNGPLGESDNTGVWTPELIANSTSGEVIIEARRRVRIWFKAYREKILADLRAADPGRDKPEFIAQRQELAEELQRKIDANLEKEKDEAMRRVMPLLAPRWKK
ncbi:hypothetical protein PG996_015908 [Apiospora saccharicola]|uniref:Uncharacterized protein n=1 Tax=Apiospora saccharicola TaxID=335842 RepID=A0ABR1TMJ5_9PEZI